MSFKVRKPKRIVTFLGAGASAPFGYPTTKSFLEKLCQYTTGEEKNLLNDIRNLHLIVKDVEHVVEILDSILDVENISKKGRLRSFFHEYPLFLDFAINKKERARKNLCCKTFCKTKSFYFLRSVIITS